VHCGIATWRAEVGTTLRLAVLEEPADVSLTAIAVVVDVVEVRMLLASSTPAFLSASTLT
jgi:hypothetical protein